MNKDTFLDRLFRRVPWYLTLMVGLWVLVAHFVARNAIFHLQEKINADRNALRQVEEKAEAFKINWAAIEALKAKDTADFKQGIESLATSKKTQFEAGLQLHEEKRLLEKQWEILVTSLQLDTTAHALRIYKDDEPIGRVALSTAGLVQYGEPEKHLLASARITSKERFAHPERGKAELVNGVLTWTPPMVGTSIRSNALGEYVMFTDSALILHGPPTKAEDHDAYPHACLNLSLAAAKSLYNKTFIGTRVNLSQQ